MRNLETIKHKGKSIFLLDISGADPGDVKTITEEAHKKIATVPPKSALILTDVTDAVYTSVSSAAIKDFSSKNTPYVKASAVVGADGLRSVLLQAVASITKREIRTFKTRDEAMDWLAAHN
jgi:hypothetical protein